MTNKLRDVASKARRKLLGVRPVAPTPYATHLPVLAGLATIYPVRRVLELGSGPFSTGLFLDRSAFPDLETLVSYEDVPDWRDQVLDQVGEDPRLDFRLVEAVRLSVPEALDEFDLIFIDDSRTPAERATTIRAVADRSPRGLVAIHDFEQRPYREAARAFDGRFVFRTFTPQVGVCWNGDTIDNAQLKALARSIEANRNTAPTEVEAWARIFV